MGSRLPGKDDTAGEEKGQETASEGRKREQSHTRPRQRRKWSPTAAVAGGEAGATREAGTFIRPVAVVTQGGAS